MQQDADQSIASPDVSLSQKPVVQFQKRGAALFSKPLLPKPWRLQTRANLLASEEAQKLKKAIGLKQQKQQGTFGSKKVSSRPSTNHDSSSQAGQQSSLVPNISRIAEINVSQSAIFSLKNATETP